MPQPMDIEKATESTFAKAVTRFVMPLLVTVVGSMLTWMVNDMRSNQTRQQSEMQGLANQVQRVDAKVELMNSKVDNGLIWRISELERRLLNVESAARTP